MKTRGTRGGILLSLDKEDRLEDLDAIVAEHEKLLTTNVVIELTERVAWDLVSQLAERIEALGGKVTDVRPPSTLLQARGETVIIARTIRSGGQIDSSGSLIILGDVNAGAEVIAEDDIIIIGTLRGIAHAGASGNEQAIIWAQKILSPQLRIAGALAQSGDHSEDISGPEVAHLHEGQITLRPWEK